MDHIHILIIALFKGAIIGSSKIGFKVSIAKGRNDSPSLIYEIDYAQGAGIDDQLNFIIYNEKLTDVENDKVLFDRNNPEDFSDFQSLQLSADKSLLAAIRHKQVLGTPLEIDSFLEEVVTQIGKFNKFRLDPLILSQPSRLPDISEETNPIYSPRIGYHGEDLAASLYYLKETAAPELSKIVSKIKEIDDNFEGFEFNTVGPDRVAFSLVYSDQRKAIPSVRVSSGMLSYIGLTTWCYHQIDQHF